MNRKKRNNRSSSKLSDKQTHLDHKKNELNDILSETEKEETALLKKSEEFQKLIEERLVNAYLRIRGNVKNGLAVVPIERGASGIFLYHSSSSGAEIASRKKSYYR